MSNGGSASQRKSPPSLQTSPTRCMACVSCANLALASKWAAHHLATPLGAGICNCNTHLGAGGLQAACPPLQQVVVGHLTSTTKDS